MRKVGRIAFTLAACAALGTEGCATRQLGHEQADMRLTMINLYESQVLDNLVRLRNNRGILHLDYSRATGTVTHGASAEISGNEGDTRNNVRQFSSANPAFSATSFLATKVIQNTFGGKASATLESQMAVTADPVTTSPELYNAYLEYLQKDSGLLVARAWNLPSRSSVHVGQWFEGDYYYVPKTHAPDFLALYLKTTVQRSAVLRSRAFKVDVKHVLSVTSVDDAPGVYAVRLKLSAKIFNDAGRIRVPIAGLLREFRLQPDPEASPDPGTTTSEPILIFDENESTGLTVKDFVDKIYGQPAEIELDSYASGDMKTEDLLEGIRSELERIRIQGSK